MTTVKIYQIGVGEFGRHGFEKIVQMTKDIEELKVELAGICDSNIDQLKAAERFARHHGVEPETFTKIDEMYEQASGDNVLVYDAGPSELHPDNIYESLQHGFHHLAEKPSSMGRDDHIAEKRLAENKNVTFAVDFIERENPVVKKTLELLDGEDIEELKVFRESCMAAHKAVDPVKRSAIVGGDILDKMVHEAYILDFLETSQGDYGVELEEAECRYLAPNDFGSEKLMGYQGGYTENLKDSATGMTRAEFSSDNTVIQLHSSWMGISREAKNTASKIKESTGAEVISNDFFESDGEAFRDDEARFFVLKGSINLAGDMLHKKLYDLDSGEEIVTRDHLHDQLYRMIENTVFQTADLEDQSISDKETDVFMNALFDVREEALKGKELISELDRGNSRLEKLRIRDGKILENEESERIAG